jgi:hypothetical protein
MYFSGKKRESYKKGGGMKLETAGDEMESVGLQQPRCPEIVS